MSFFSSKPDPKQKQDKELRRMGYSHLSGQLKRGFDEDLKRSGGRMTKMTCPHCGCTAINGRCPNCGEKFL